MFSGRPLRRWIERIALPLAAILSLSATPNRPPLAESSPGKARPASADVFPAASATESHGSPEPPAPNIRRFVIPSRSRSLDAAYFSNRSGSPGRAVLVVNANGFPLGDIDSFARVLCARGYSVLTVQNPAFPVRVEGPDGRARFDPHGLKNSNLPDKAEDLRNAIRFLESEPTADASHLSLVGIGLGANLVAVLAAREPNLSAVVFVAPGRSCDPNLMVPFLSAIHPHPALLIAREDDADFRAAFALPGAPERSVIEEANDAPELTGEAVNVCTVPKMDEIASWLVVQSPPAGR